MRTGSGGRRHRLNMRPAGERVNCVAADMHANRAEKEDEAALDGHLAAVKSGELEVKAGMHSVFSTKITRSREEVTELTSKIKWH